MASLYQRIWALQCTFKTLYCLETSPVLFRWNSEQWKEKFNISRSPSSGDHSEHRLKKTPNHTKPEAQKTFIHWCKWDEWTKLFTRNFSIIISRETTQPCGFKILTQNICRAALSDFLLIQSKTTMALRKKPNREHLFFLTCLIELFATQFQHKCWECSLRKSCWSLTPQTKRTETKPGGLVPK